MKYYLVALFDEESYSLVEDVQRSLCRRYRTYKNMPALHITMEVIGDPDIEKLTRIIYDIIKPYKRFKVQVNEAICFNPPYKSVNLKVESKGYIMRLVRQINDTLKLYGFEVREDIHDWDFNVNLANTALTAREWSKNEYAAACETAKKENINKMLRIDRIELWKPISNKREMVVRSFPLREF